MVNSRAAASLVWIFLLVGVALGQTPAEEEDESTEELRKRIERLEQQIAELAAEAPDDAKGSGAEKAERKHVPGQGLLLGKASWGEVNFSVYAYLRYLNQKSLDESYTDSFGTTRDLDLRNDLQFQKVVLYFNGWIYNPKFRYLLYVWTSNTSQGLGAQVVVAGNLSWKFNDRLTLGGGIGALPANRSLRGSWPYWLKEDNRFMADEYFRGSYTSGIWASGKMTEKSKYKVMIGNNLSQLGVDAGQLDGSFNTWSGAVWWMPTTGEFGFREGFGDFEHHDKLATSFGLHATRSPEDAQSQPGVDDAENSQIRISDGNIIFQSGLFAPNTQIREATYNMTSLDGGLKYKGWSLDAEYFWRWIDDLSVSGSGTLPVDELRDHGFQVQASAMALPETLQVYVGGSKVFGEYGEPWDAAGGINWFFLQRDEVRFQLEALYLDHSAVGNLSIPSVVGGNGWVFHSSFSVYW